MVKAKITGETEYRDAYLEELVREIVDEPPSENTSHLEETMYDADEVQNIEPPENCTDIFICKVCHEDVRDADMNRHHESYRPEIAIESPEQPGQSFVCVACGAHVNDVDMDEHHEMYHPEISWEVNLFQLKEKSCEETSDEQFDVDDETEQPGQSFICTACGAHVNDVDMDEHHEMYHSEISWEVNLFQLKEKSCEETEQPIQSFICIACGKPINDVDLDAHRTRYHSMLPFTTNIYLPKEKPSFETLIKQLGIDEKKEQTTAIEQQKRYSQLYRRWCMRQIYGYEKVPSTFSSTC